MVRCNIIYCYKCGQLHIVEQGQKRKRCVYCNENMQVAKAKVKLRGILNVQDAGVQLKNLKMEAAGINTRAGSRKK